MSVKFSFIHTADIHLGRAFSDINFELSESQRSILKVAHEEALNTLGNFAQNNRVDFILIAGDTFDYSEQDLHARLVLSRFLTRMEQAGIKVYLICGNHDPQISYPSEWSFKSSDMINLFGVNCEQKPCLVEKDGFPVARLYPFGFREKVCMESPSDILEKACSKDLFNIGLIHCDYTTQNHPYAPCSEKSLLELDYDYYALGHIHKPIFNDKLIYPGTIQARSCKDSGEHGFCYVTVENCEVVSNQFIICDKVRYYEIEYSLTDVDTAVEAVENLSRLFDGLIKDAKLLIINLTLKGVCKFSRQDIKDFKQTLSTENIVVSNLYDTSKPYCLDIENIKPQEGVLGHLVSMISDDGVCENLIKKTESDLKEVLKLAPDIDFNEILEDSKSELKDICIEILAEEVGIYE